MGIFSYNKHLNFKENMWKLKLKVCLINFLAYSLCTFLLYCASNGKPCTDGTSDLLPSVTCTSRKVKTPVSLLLSFLYPIRFPAR